MRTRIAGQASLEYVGLLALTGAVLAVAAGVAFAVPAIPRSVVHAVRLGMCIVGGDVCRPADAAARGLEPCVVAEDARDHHGQIGAVVQALGDDHWSVTRGSDGLWTLTVAAGGGVGGSVGTGMRYRGVHLGVDASAAGRFTRGLQWRLPAAQMRAALARVSRPENLVFPWVARQAGLPHATRAYVEGSGSAGATVSGGALTLGHADAAGALGRASGGGPTVWYFHGAGSLSTLLPALGLPPGGGTLEYRESSPPAIVVRTSVAQTPATEVDRVTTWPLHDAVDGADVLHALRHPGSALGALRARAAAEATTERRVYRTTVRTTGFGFKLLGIGFDQQAVSTTRRLVDARVLTGPVPAVRYDCLGLDRS